MSPCCKYCPDDGQSLLMLKKKWKIVLQLWRWLIHGRSLHRAGLFVETPEAFPSKSGDATSRSLEAGLHISSSNLFFSELKNSLQRNSTTNNRAGLCLAPPGGAHFMEEPWFPLLTLVCFPLLTTKMFGVCVCVCTTTDFQIAAVDNISSRIMLNTSIKKGGIHYPENILACKVCTWLQDESILAVQSSCVS